jgi:hypothetical protein
MKRFSQLKLTKGLLVLFTLGVTLALYSVLPDYYDRTFQVQAQLQQQIDPNWINQTGLADPPQ